MGCNDSAARAVYTDRISGVPTYYNAANVQRTGTRASFYYDRDFYDHCNLWMDDLGDLSGGGKPDAVSSLGTWVNRNDGCRSQHNYGTAFDLSALWWYDRRGWVADNYEGDKRFYMGVAANTNHFFTYSLDYNYNRAHHNHIHFDKSITPSRFSRGSTSQVKFVQASISHVWDRAITIDGLWGPQTEGAVREVLEGLPLSGVLTADWMSYCRHTAYRGMTTAF